jgi:hypothetical protein
MHECRRYCPIVDPVWDTFDSVQVRSSFLLSSILSVAARAKCGSGNPTRTLVECSEEAFSIAGGIAVGGSYGVEDIQAMAVLSTWHKCVHFRRPRGA